MDTIEATKMVMSRIHNIDPENASKIMGYILIQDNGENDMIRLAFGPENLLTSVIKQAKTFLDISSNTSSAFSSPSPFHHQTPPQIVIPDNGYNHMNHPLLYPHSSSGSFQDRHISPRLASYSSMINGGDSSAFYNNEVTEEYGGTCGNDDADGWRPCMHFDRGFCQNGTNCKFVHGDGVFGDEMCSSPAGVFESPTGVNVDGFEDFLRIKAMQEQRVAEMAAGGYNRFCFNRCMNFVSESPRSPSEAAALMMREDFHKFGRLRPHRHDLAAMGLGNSSSSSRHIYLTFPADSTFKEEDVSNYFSIFGPVQDVRIPHQQKRMFGFVAFVLAETVKSVLAKGNPHFVCDSRVLVKPYKEKGTIPFKKHHHQIERGDISALEFAEPFDHVPFGARMFSRRNLEGQNEYEQTIDFQERKLMNMQLTTENQLQHSLSRSLTDQSFVHVSKLNVYGEEINGNDTQELLTEGSDSKVPQGVNDDDREINSSNGSYIHESSVEHILPDNLFASPTKTAATGHQSTFSSKMPEPDDDGGCANINQTSLNMTSLKSC